MDMKFGLVTGMFVMLSIHIKITVSVAMPPIVDAITVVHVATAGAIDRMGAAILIFLGGGTFSLVPAPALVTKKI